MMLMNYYNAIVSWQTVVNVQSEWWELNLKESGAAFITDAYSECIKAEKCCRL